MSIETDLSPVAVETEAVILGAALRSPAAYAETLITALVSDDFVRPVHQQLYDMIAGLYGEGIDPGFLPVQQAAMRARTLHVVDYLTRLLADDIGLHVTDAGSFEYHVAQVQAAGFRRRLADAGASLHAATSLDDAEQLRERAREILDAVPERDAAEGITWADLHLRELERAESPSAVATVPVPFKDLAGLLDGGLRAGEVVVVAARPAIGKTVIGVELARHAALKGVRTVMVSLEMTEAEIGARLIASTARVLLSHTKKMAEVEDALSGDDWQRIAKASDKIAEQGQNLVIVEPKTAFTVPALDRRLTVMARKGQPAGFVVIDYLQLMETIGTSRAENRQVEVSQMSRAIKLLAKKHGIPVAVLAQLNRGPEQRADHKPMPSDLRESGAIEQDASLVILLHREDAYDKESPRAGEMDLIVAKNRNGATGTVTVAFQGHYATAADMAAPPAGY
jgi:replicative DNA helicase